MAFDIYGEPLLPGHCEVHTWVPLPYPCHICLQEQQQTRDVELRNEEIRNAHQYGMREGREDAAHKILTAIQKAYDSGIRGPASIVKAAYDAAAEIGISHSEFKIYAQLTAQGTACSEIAVCSIHVQPDMLTTVTPGDPWDAEKDQPVTVHVDCSGNEALACIQCGRKAS